MVNSALTWGDTDLQRWRSPAVLTMFRISASFVRVVSHDANRQLRSDMSDVAEMDMERQETRRFSFGSAAVAVP